MTATKRCGKCGLEKPVTEFHRQNKRKDGRQGRCKSCQGTMPQQSPPAEPAAQPARSGPQDTNYAKMYGLVKCERGHLHSGRNCYQCEVAVRTAFEQLRRLAGR